MKKKYYNVVGWECIDNCYYMQDIRIGSHHCNECEYCIELNEKDKWVICEMYNKAKEKTIENKTNLNNEIEIFLL